MESPGIRTAFGPRYANATLNGRAMMLGAAGLVISAVAAATGHSLVLPVLVPLSLILLVGGAVARLGLTQQFRIAFASTGVEVRSRGRTSRLPWSDVAAWGIGDPTGGRSPGRLVALLAWPAEHVTDASSGSAAAIWSGLAGAWIVCLPHQTDGTVEEMVGALAQVAPQVPRRDGNPG